MKLSEVKSLHITEYFKSIIKYSSSFRKKTRFLLNGAFECAIDNDFCVKNPVRRAAIAKKTESEKMPFTEAEAKAITEFAKTDEIFGIPIYIMFNSGIRSQEMRALKVNKIDFESRIMTIDTAVKRTGYLGTTKNGETYYVPLKSEVIDFLKIKLQGKTGYVLGGDEYVTYSGFRVQYESFFERLNNFLENEGKEPIKRKSPHTSRHTVNTIRQKKGMPPAIAAALLGQKSLEVNRKYTHLGDIDTLTEAVSKYSDSD